MKLFIRILTLAATTLILNPALSIAQVLEDLKAPSMPSATIIGTQINEITRPKTLKALETALLNNFTDANNNILIPNNYAFEVTPFMLTKRTNFNYLSYLDDSLKKNLWRNLSFSVASTNNYVVNDSISCNALGFGLRTIVLNGNVNEKLEDTYKKIIIRYDSLRDLSAELREEIKFYLKEDKPFVPDDLRIYLLKDPRFKSADIAKAINEVFGKIPKNTDKMTIESEFSDQFKKTLTTNALKEFRDLIDRVQTERYGWRFEIDAAFALSFPTNDFDYSFTPKQGIWANLSYRPFKKEKEKSEGGKTYKVPRNFEFIGLVRWINNDESFINKFNPIDTLEFKPGEFYDFGLRTVFELEKFSAEIEYIYRLNKNTEHITVNGNEYSRTINDDTYKLLLNLNYNLTDNIVFSYNIGQNFDSPGLTGGNLISGFSLNFGFGSVKAEDLVKEGMREVE